ncbi:hypothetical protein SPI_02774 [Niveomyces insectorum RCEF 264]|uniref:Uncharacterized protein n=1 Tax=Niveomyces insectorum RCEF 264 TaxID=1081102 RepID=A0A167Y8U1_9HYPO|nr:hypothetical protein SPI_02774 [Niveomyces insectorum RCEF 264]
MAPMGADEENVHHEAAAADAAASSRDAEPDVAIDPHEHACEVCISWAISRCRGAAPSWRLRCEPGPASRCAVYVSAKRCCEVQPAGSHCRERPGGLTDGRSLGPAGAAATPNTARLCKKCGESGAAVPGV